MWKSVLIALLGGAGIAVVLGGILFGSAGRMDLPTFWAFIGLWTAAMVIGGLLADPTLARERIRPGPGGKDYLVAILMIPVWLGQFVVAGLDMGRFHWSDSVPLAVQVLALVAMAGGLAVVTWAVAVNRFFSSVIRIQTDRGHHLIASGPYRYVRHPAYAVCVILFAGGGLALGSWLAALIGLVLTIPILRRTALEDQTLREQLEGYAAYAEKVRYRLIPGVW
jgi:protein-S-isoprenylcysteine O-methyltransferase Ste14